MNRTFKSLVLAVIAGLLHTTYAQTVGGFYLSKLGDLLDSHGDFVVETLEKGKLVETIVVLDMRDTFQQIVVKMDRIQTGETRIFHDSDADGTLNRFSYFKPGLFDGKKGNEVITISKYDGNIYGEREFRENSLSITVILLDWERRANFQNDPADWNDRFSSAELELETKLKTVVEKLNGNKYRKPNALEKRI